jgi:hypothetical protein
MWWGTTGTTKIPMRKENKWITFFLMLAFMSQIGLGGTEYISSHGTPLYKLRKRYPHYGRRKRDLETILSRKPRQSPWTLLTLLQAESSSKNLSYKTTNWIYFVWYPFYNYVIPNQKKQLEQYYRTKDFMAVGLWGSFVQENSVHLYT